MELWKEPLESTYGIVTIGEYGGWLVQVIPMLFNDRLVLTPKSCEGIYDHGWCYPKGGAAHLAAMLWDPDTEGEPAGAIKTATSPIRKAGEHADE